MTTVEFQDVEFQDGEFRDGEFRDLVLVRRAPGDAPAATAVIRVLGKLPGGWEHAWRLDEDGGRIHLRIRPPSGSPAHAVRDWLAEALTDPALGGWRAAERL